MITSNTNNILKDGKIPDSWTWYALTSYGTLYRDGLDIIVLFSPETDQYGEPKIERKYKRLKPITE